MWNKNIFEVPYNIQILVRHKNWHCPAVIQRNKRGSYDEWCYVEDALYNEYGNLSATQLIGLEWTYIPE